MRLGVQIASDSQSDFYFLTLQNKNSCLHLSNRVFNIIIVRVNIFIITVS